MSTSCFWEPVVPCDKRKLGNSIKHLLANHYFDIDGSITNSTFFNKDALDYLRGVRDAAASEEVVLDAQQLIDAIIEYGKIKFSIVN